MIILCLARNILIIQAFEFQSRESHLYCKFQAVLKELGLSRPKATN